MKGLCEASYRRSLVLFIGSCKELKCFNYIGSTVFEKFLQQGVLDVLRRETGKGELGCVSERFAGPVVIEYGWMNVLKCGIVLFAENGFRSLL